MNRSRFLKLLGFGGAAAAIPKYATGGFVPAAQAAVVPSGDVQVFTSSGTWTKPSGVLTNITIMPPGPSGEEIVARILKVHEQRPRGDDDGLGGVPAYVR